MQTLLTVLVVLVLVAMYVTWLAGRLDRQHVRVEAGRSALDAALVRRAALAEQLAERLAEHGVEHGVGPADTSTPAAGQASPVGQASPAVLAAAARRARDADGEHRERAENDLTRVLRPMVARALSYGEPLTDVVGQLSAATTRIGLARTIYNNAVDYTLALRRRRLVRWLRLAGRAAAPAYFEIDDTWQT